MDTLPPPPPALVQDQAQPAIDAYERLLEVQRWFDVQQRAIPAIPDNPDIDHRAPYLDALTGFWRERITLPDGDTSVRFTVLANQLAAAVAGIAQLQALDGSLDSAGASIAVSAGRTVGTPPPGVEYREITFGDAAYAGAFVAMDSRDPGVVMLFSQDRGWDRFASLDDAVGQVHRLARQALTTREDLPGLGRHDLAGPGGLGVAGSRVIEGDPLIHIANRLVSLQREKLDHAWLAFSLERALPDRSQRLADRLRDALQLTDFLDTESILAVREGKLYRALATARLATLPTGSIAEHTANAEGVRDAWQAAHDQYIGTLRATAARRAAAGSRPLMGLHDFTVDKLRTQLRQAGIDESPADIVVTRDRSLDPASRISSLPSLIEGPASERMDLIELAYMNVPAAGLDSYSASTRDGKPLPALGDARIRQIVRAVDIHTSYLPYVASTWLEGAQGTIHRDTAMTLQAARMRLEAVEARLVGMATVSSARAAGLSQRGWTWVREVLDTPDGATNRAAPGIAGATLAVRQVWYGDAPIRDVVEVSLSDLPWAYASVPGIGARVYYTPDAPDGIVFREFNDWTDAQREFFKNPRFAEYLIDRLPSAFSEVPENGHARRFKAWHELRFVFGSTEPDGYTPTEHGFVPRDVVGNLFAAMHDARASLIRRDVGDATRSAADANARQLHDLFGLRPERLAGRIAVGILNAPFEIALPAWRAYDHLREGRYGDAFADLTESYVAAASTASSGTLIGRAAASFRTRAGITTRPVAIRPQAFEQRYRAEGIARTGHPDLQGMYSIDGKRYVAIDGQLYHAHYDAHNRTVRLSTGQPLDAHATGPAIHFHEARWKHNRHIGLRGGMDEVPGPSREVTFSRNYDLYNEYTVQLERAFPDAFERHVVTSQMHRELNRLPPLRAITPEQRIRYDRAWAIAEQTLRPAYGEGPATLPGTLRAVDPATLPETLWFYGEKPFYSSSLLRTRHSPSTMGSGDWAALIGDWQGQGVVGVRVTTVPPWSQASVLEEATVLRPFRRSRAFAVELHLRDILATQIANGTPVTVLEPTGGAGNTYILRPAPGHIVEMRAGQFFVFDRLAAPEPVPAPGTPASLDI